MPTGGWDHDIHCPTHCTIPGTCTVQCMLHGICCVPLRTTLADYCTERSVDSDGMLGKMGHETMATGAEMRKDQFDPERVIALVVSNHDVSSRESFSIYLAVLGPVGMGIWGTPYSVHQTLRVSPAEHDSFRCRPGMLELRRKATTEGDLINVADNLLLGSHSFKFHPTSISMLSE